MRDRLKRLIDDLGIDIILTEDEKQHIADYLFNSGVIVPPCKVGDKVYRIWSVGKHGKSVAEFVVTNVSQIMENTWVIRYQKQAKSLYSTPTIYQCDFNDIGKTVFLTREEAEKALAERSEG
jgi:hypothetical protein